MTHRPPRPDTRRLDQAATPSPAPARPDTRPADAGMPATASAGAPNAPSPRRGKLIWPRVCVAGLGLLGVAVAGAYVQEAVATVMNPTDWAGWLVTGGVGLVIAGLVLGCVGELRGFRDLRRLDRLNDRARQVREDAVADDPSLIRDLTAVYASRPDLDGKLRTFRRDAEGIGDAANQLAAFEIHVLANLDERAQLAITRAVRRNATATALSPFALLDASVTAWTSLRMIREVATLYGARPRVAASLRLTRTAFGNVLAAGLFETVQDAVNDLVSGGVAGRVSTSMASAIANGLLTARLGLAAMEACRPVPTSTSRRTSARSLVRRALSDVIGGHRPQNQPDEEA